jgi:hypothetical protein
MKIEHVESCGTADLKAAKKIHKGRLDKLASERHGHEVFLDTYIQNELTDGLRPATINREMQLLGQAFTLAMRSKPPRVTTKPNIRRLSEKGQRTEEVLRAGRVRAGGKRVAGISATWRASSRFSTSRKLRFLRGA